MFHRNSNYEIQIMSYFDNVVNSAPTRIMELLGKVLKRKNPLRLSIKYVRNIFRKTNISNPLIRTRTCAYQEVRNVSFSENFAYVLNGRPLLKNLQFY